MKLSGQTKTVLILPEEPTPREALAGEELTRYLKRTLDVEARRESTPVPGANNLIIGGPGRNAACPIGKEEFESLLTGEEGMLIEVGENTVLIAGSEGFDDMERGTLYAAYEFIERYLHCCLAAYSAPGNRAGEYIPREKEIDLPRGRYVKAHADRPYRTAIVQYGERAGDPYHHLNQSFLEWMAKNRYNRMLVWASIYEAYRDNGFLPEFEKRGIRLTVGHHEASSTWLPAEGNKDFPEHYYQTHPEYYRLCADGTRFRPVNERGQLVYCARNEECIEQVSENINKWIDRNPQVDMIAFWPNDGVHEQCCCEKCAPHSKVENYTYFLNSVAKRVGKRHPRAKIDMLIYVDLWRCPDGVRLEPNLHIDEATWAKEQRKCGKPDGSCLSGTEYEENILRWRDAGARVFYYDYYMGVFGNRQRVIPMADEIQSIWQHFTEAGIEGAGTQIECFNHWNHLVNFYTFGRTGYDTSLSLEDNLSAIAPLFGEGADEVLAAIRIMEDTLDGQEPIYLSGKYMIEHVDKEAVYACFERALSKTSDPLCRNNIRLMRMAFRYSEIETADPANNPRKQAGRFQDYEDPTGELAYMATRFDSFRHNNPGWAIAFPVTNTDSRDFAGGYWYDFE